MSVERAWTLQARDAWNGTLLWTRPRDPAVARRRWSLAADASGIYGYLATGEDLVAIDPATGETKRTFPGTTPVLGNGKPGLDSETVCIRLLDDALLVSVNGAVHCFDKRTATRRWSFAREGAMAFGMVADAGTKRVYALLGARRAEENFKGRWPASKQVQALLALDLTNGKPVWECTGIASVPIGDGAKKDVRGPGQIVPMGDRVVVFGNASVYNNDHPYIATVAAVDGALLFSDDEPFKKDYNRSGYNMLARDGAIWFAGNTTRIWRYDPLKGTTTEVMSYSWNSRCTRFTATPNWFLFGQSGWFAKDLSGEQIPVARSGCAIGNIPANGLTYFTPNACGCITMLRGFHATSSEPVPSPIPAAERLRTGGAAPTPASAPAEPLPSGPVARDWTRTPRLAAVRSATVAVGNLEIRAVVHQHRIEARRGGALVWTAMADARISGAPVVVGDSVVFGAHDGCVYGVALTDGRPLFRYQLALARRLIVANGQVESAWPIYGLAVRDGRVVASAGTHPGIGGGVAVAILDPRTGRPEWTTLLTLRPNVIPAGGGRLTIIDRSFMNSVPRLEDGRIRLGEGGRIGGGFSFSPDETSETILNRLHEPPRKKN
jgi:outer membrane protein assembly factor BamB